MSVVISGSLIRFFLRLRKIGLSCCQPPYVCCRCLVSQALSRFGRPQTLHSQHLFVCRVGCPAPNSAACLGCRQSGYCPLSDQRLLQLGKGAHDLECHQLPPSIRTILIHRASRPVPGARSTANSSANPAALSMSATISSSSVENHSP